MQCDYSLLFLFQPHCCAHACRFIFCLLRRRQLQIRKKQRGVRFVAGGKPGLAIVSHAFGHLAKEKRLMTCFTLSCDSFLSISDVWPKKHIPRVERKMTLLSDKRESINRLFYLTLDRIWFGISDFESINRFTRLSSTRLTDFVCIASIFI